MAIIGNTLKTAILAAALTLGGTAVRGEVLTVSGYVPAGSDGAAALVSLSIENFGGREGSALAIEIEDVIRDVEIDGQRYFRLLPPTGGTDPDAVLRGTADREVRRERVTQKRSVCIARNDKGKCQEKARRDVNCWQRTVRLEYTLRLTAHNGNLLHRADDSREQQHTWCPQDSDPDSVDSIVRGMVDDVAEALRYDFAPSWRVHKIRVLESRKGLSSGSQGLFRSAIRLTKTDEIAACEAFGDVARADPAHVPALFNIALCAERAGDREAARSRYRAVLQREPGNGNARDGIARLDGYDRADRQLATHYGA